MQEERIIQPTIHIPHSITEHPKMMHITAMGRHPQLPAIPLAIRSKHHTIIAVQCCVAFLPSLLP
jgi:hypothetical protein